MSLERLAFRAKMFGLLSLLALSSMCAQSAFGQADTSSLSGTITDSSGAVLPSAKITVHNNATGKEYATTATGTGFYTVTNLAPGTYTVRVEATGFETEVQQGIQVDPSIGRRLDAALKPGNTSTTVTVQGDINTLQTESAAVGQLVTTDQVKSIQLNGRNPIYLSQLEPGVARNAAMSAFNFSPDFGGPVINGARSNESLLTLDGAPMIRTRANGTSIGVADVDSVSQVQILTTTYPAQYGGTSGGIIAQCV
jgi:hypothetical protein